MADTSDFFNNFLPAKLENDPSVKDIGAVYLFDIGGAGQWTVDLKEGTVTEGGHESPDCTVSCDKDNWEQMLDNPGMAMMLFGQGQLRIDNLQLGMSLQQILS